MKEKSWGWRWANKRRIVDGRKGEEKSRDGEREAGEKSRAHERRRDNKRDAACEIKTDEDRGVESGRTGKATRGRKKKDEVKR